MNSGPNIEVSFWAVHDPSATWAAHFSAMHNPLLSPDDMLGCGPRPGDEAHEAARVHHPSRRRSSHLAAHGARAAAGEAADHRFPGHEHGFGLATMDRRFRAAAA